MASSGRLGRQALHLHIRHGMLHRHRGSVRVRSLWDAAGAAGWIGGMRTGVRFVGMPPALVRALLVFRLHVVCVLVVLFSFVPCTSPAGGAGRSRADNGPCVLLPISEGVSQAGGYARAWSSGLVGPLLFGCPACTRARVLLDLPLRWAYKPSFCFSCSCACCVGRYSRHLPSVAHIWV